MSFTPDLFSLFPPPTAESLGLSDSDAAWAFEPDADPAQMPMQMQFSDIADIDIPDVADIEIPDVPDLLPADGHVHADVHAGHDSPVGYQTSHGSSLSGPESRSTSASSALFMWPPSPPASSHPRFPAGVEAPAPAHAGHLLQAKLCTSQRPGGAETCLTAALRTLTALHMAHSACLSAHREAPAAQQTRKMETVLATNKDVVAGMAPVLACACSGRSMVQLLLLSICGSLIAWNSAMISANLDAGGDGDDDPFAALSASAAAAAADPSQAPRARVLPQPITIGEHRIGGKLGRVLHTQVMAGELRVLEGLVDAVSRRLGEASRADGAASPSPAATHARSVNGRAATARDTPSLQSRGLANNVHRHIISSLRTRLEHTRAKIFSQA